MSDQTSVFEMNQETATQPIVSPQTQTNSYEDRLKAIKNEHGSPKYANLEEALKALEHSQAYIPEVKGQLSQKEAEIAALKAELEKRQAVEDVVARLSAPNEPAQVNQPAAGLSEADITRLVQAQLQNTAAAQTATQNLSEVDSALRAKYGDKAGEVVKQRAGELGITPQALGELSSKNPKMVLALFGANAATSPRPTTSSVMIPSTYDTQAVPLAKPEKTLLTGASTKDQMAYMAKVRADVYARHGIKTQ